MIEKRAVIELQVKEITDKILKGNFVNENYLSQFNHVKMQNPIRRFFLYKSDIEHEWKGVDCDVSLAGIVTLGLIYDWLGTDKNIDFQTKSLLKYRIKSVNDNWYLADTMTSAQTFFKEYLHLLWKEEKTSVTYKALFEESRGKLSVPKVKNKSYYENLFDYLTENIIWDNEFLNIVDEEVSAEAKVFLSNYLKSGNCIVVSENFNTERNGYGKLDSVDRMLWKIYQYFSERNEKYLSELFVNSKNKEKPIEKFKTWLSDAQINSWDKFISDNILEPFIDMQSKEKRPISMKTGHCIANKVDEDYKPMPKTLEEFEIFFKNLNKRITLRSRLIWQQIRRKYSLCN